MFLPPLEVPLARFLVTTLASITWAVARNTDESCKLAQGYDHQKHLEYIEIKCDKLDIDKSIMRMWSMKGNSVTEVAWNNIELLYDEKNQKIVFNAGGFPGKYKRLQEILFTKYTRYTFARGFAIEAYRKEEENKQVGGFIDFSLKGSIPFLFGLNTLRRKLRTVYENKVVNILLGDLGDRSLALKEAVSALYSPTITNNTGKVSISKPIERLGIKLPPQKLGVDINTFIVYSLQLKIVSNILQGSIELVSRWPTISIAIYKAGGRGQGDDTRPLNIITVDSEEVFATLEGIRASAEDIGAEPLRLANGLTSMLNCVYELARRGEHDTNTASALLSHGTPLIDSLMRGFVDRDLHYHVIRLLESISQKRGVPPQCIKALHSLA